ncbi:hypothetical protein L249_3991, partial [Ophiocordyceps polyrhachis-furcata BCC 54312]
MCLYLVFNILATSWIRAKVYDVSVASVSSPAPYPPIERASIRRSIIKLEYKISKASIRFPVHTMGERPAPLHQQRFFVQSIGHVEMYAKSLLLNLVLRMALITCQDGQRLFPSPFGKEATQAKKVQASPSSMLQNFSPS